MKYFVYVLLFIFLIPLSIATCEDGTKAGHCSEENVGYYCDFENILIEYCDECECEAGEFCNLETEHCEIFEVNASCVEVVPDHNSLEEERINVVFLGFNFDQREDFILLSNAIIDYNGDYYGLLFLEPFKSNADKFNFWYVDNSDIGLKVEGGKIPYDENYKIEELLSRCVFEDRFPIVLVDDEKFGYAIFNGNAYAGIEEQEIDVSIYNYCLGNDLNNDGCVNEDDISIIEEKQLDTKYPTECHRAAYGCTNENLEDPKIYNLRSKIMLAVHEFSHSFGLLDDERANNVHDTREDITSVNCFVATETDDCLVDSPWSDLIGYGCGNLGVIDCQEENKDYSQEIGCFEGCKDSTLGIFRPTRSSMMSQAIIDEGIYTFGLVNQRQLCTRIKELTGDSGGYCEIFSSEGKINEEVYLKYFEQKEKPFFEKLFDWIKSIFI